MKEKILIVCGDPNSINSELIFKCWRKINNSLKKKIYLIGNYNLMKAQFKKLKYKTKIQKVENINNDIKTNNLKIINVDLSFKKPFDVSYEKTSRYVLKSLNFAHKLALQKNVKGLINCSVNKLLLKKGNMGVTEYLAKKCSTKKNSEVMLIRNKKFSVSPITTHIDIKNVTRTLNKELIKKKSITVDSWFRKYLHKKPLIGMLGLNPHNSELRKSSEEIKIIIPAIKELKRKNVKIYGPLVPDTTFIKDFKKYDIILGMYHDQVLTPFKTIFKFDAINVTLGLKYLRVSPDHGTAINLIGKNKANPISLLKCINFINKFGK